MNSYTEDYDNLFDNLERFSPEIDETDLYDPPSHATTSHSSNSPISNFNIRFLSQNINKSNAITHSLLNSCGHNTDIFFIQEPWFDRIGIDIQTGINKIGVPNHPQFNHIISDFTPEHKPDVAAYFPKHHPGWTIQPRSDLISHPSILLLEITFQSHTLYAINIYNPSDSSALIPLYSTLSSLYNAEVVVTGDFNLHHPLWSKEEHDNKITDDSEDFVTWMVNKGFTLFNEKGISTFFRKDYQSVLDLTWASVKASSRISDFTIAYHLHTGSDHYPITWKSSFSPLPPSAESSFLFHDDNRESWEDAFVEIMYAKWNINNLPKYVDKDAIKDTETLTRAINVFMDSISEASFQTCTRKPKSPRACKWFDKETKAALNQMRKDRQRARVYPSPHNTLRALTSNKHYKYQIKRAKRSHAMAYASTVNATTDLWALNKWYRGIRKSVMPALKGKDSSWASDSKSKAELLSKTWFPNMHSNVHIPLTNYPIPRPFLPITDEEIRLAFKNLSNTSVRVTRPAYCSVSRGVV